MPGRLLASAWSWLLDLLAAAAALLVSLVTVEHVGPHVAVVLITAAEVFVAWVALPKPAHVAGGFNPEELAAYRAGRANIIRDRRLLLALWLGIGFMLVVLVNAARGFVPLPALDVYFSIGVCTALILQAMLTARRAHQLLTAPLDAVRSLLPHRSANPRTPPGGGVPSEVGDTHAP